MNVPDTRFKGFTDDWAQRKFGEVFSQTTEFVNPKEDDIELWSLTIESGLTCPSPTRGFLLMHRRSE